jgi:hypothetical protein
MSERVYPADIEAAREALRDADSKNPEFATALDTLAMRHARKGPREFSLTIGKTHPRHAREKLSLEVWNDAISQDEGKKRLEQIIQEPLSPGLLEALYEDLEESIIHYDRLLTQSSAAYAAYGRNQSFRSETAQASYHARETVRAFSLATKQISDIGRFAEDCRARKGLSSVTLGKFSAFTAMNLALNITGRASELWFDCYRKEEGSRDVLWQENVACWNFVTRHVPHLPSPHELMALVVEEFSLMRVMLKDSSVPHFLADPELPVGPLTAPSMPADSQQLRTGTKAPVLRNWAFGYDATSKTWWLFHRRERRWEARSKVAIARGHRARLMLDLAGGNGAVDRRSLVAARKSPDRSLVETGAAVDQTVTKLRGALKKAIAVAARVRSADIGDPLPLFGDRYVAEVDIGWAEPDETLPSKLRFRMQDET